MVTTDHVRKLHELTTKACTRQMMVVTCIWEPRGKFGLEGFQKGDMYLAEKITNTQPHYYRVWIGPCEWDEYETASVRAFNQVFKELI